MPEPIVLQKVVFPSAGDPDVVPLYLDPDEWSHVTSVAPGGRGGRDHGSTRTSPLRMTQVNAIPMLRGRRGLAPGNGRRVSLGAYFNAFPASYWRRWTSLTGVSLRVDSVGHGDIVVYRSNARGVIQMVDSKSVDSDETTVFDLGFDNFIDGGWYWFDVIARSEEYAVTLAEWTTLRDEAPTSSGNVTIAVTTLNRTKYCLDLLATIATDVDALAVIDRVVVVDQGSEKIRNNDRFSSIEESLGGRLQVIHQANAGGSGGFARGMLETLSEGASDYVLLLDDDVAVETESIRRAVVFSRFCADPTIVGGHMFDMYDKTRLHAFAEGIDTWNYLWGPRTPSRHNFASSSLRETDWIHERYDSTYNGWWMTLIPVEIIKEIGLSLPVFIKWDDAEFSVRAKEHGFATVSLPGVAIWHVSWVDKDDSRDWQAFYHARNRLITALLHSPHPRGGRLALANLASDVRHLLSMDYYTVKLRQLAYKSVIAGPNQLHPELLSRLPRIRALAESFPESRLVKDLGTFEKLPDLSQFGKVDLRPRGFGVFRFLAKNVLRHIIVRPKNTLAGEPDAHLPRSVPWWVIPAYDNIIVTNAEGSGVTAHVRDRVKFRTLLVSAISLNTRYWLRWPSLRAEYKAELSEVTSEQRWRRTLSFPRRERPSTSEQSARSHDRAGKSQ